MYKSKLFGYLQINLANWAKWDDDLLKLELKDLEDLNFDLKLTGFDFEKVQHFLDNVG